VFGAVLLTSLVFSLGGSSTQCSRRNFDQISFVPTFILTPLTYLGGVFYSITMLPEWAQHLSRANPILYMVNAFRYGFLGVSDVPVGFSFAIMTIAVVALFRAQRVADGEGNGDEGVSGGGGREKGVV